MTDPLKSCFTDVTYDMSEYNMDSSIMIEDDISDSDSSSSDSSSDSDEE